MDQFLSSPSIILHPGTMTCAVVDTHAGSGFTKQGLNLSPVPAKSLDKFRLPRLRLFVLRAGRLLVLSLSLLLVSPGAAEALAAAASMQSCWLTSRSANRICSAVEHPNSGYTLPCSAAIARAADFTSGKEKEKKPEECTVQSKIRSKYDGSRPYCVPVMLKRMSTISHYLFVSKSTVVEGMITVKPRIEQNTSPQQFCNCGILVMHINSCHHAVVPRKKSSKRHELSSQLVSPW